MILRDAVPGDLDALADLAIASKGYWGYAPDLLDAMRAELRWGTDDLARMRLRIGEVDGVVVGFHAVEPRDDGCAELEALFVHPRYIGRGFGRRLLDHAKAIARALDRRLLVIQSDPFAERFYLAAGARRVGERVSGSIAGRMLPLLVLDLSP